MNTRLLAMFALVVGLCVLPTLALAVSDPGGDLAAGPPQVISPAGESRYSTTANNGVPESFFDVFVQVPEFDVEIVSLSLTGIGLGVGQITTLTAQTCPPIGDTGGALQWTVLSGTGTISGTGETVDLTLEHPGPISHDTPGVVVGVEYTTGGHTVSDTLSIRLNESDFTRPYIRDYTLHFGDKPFPEPGDTVSITLEHALPPGYALVYEMIAPVEIYTDAETFVPVRLQAMADYLAPDGLTHVFDFHSEDFALPFSYDMDGNGTPDLVDAQYTAALGSLYSLPLNPAPNDPWRASEALVAHMVMLPLRPFPTLTFDPNCKPCTFGYYQWTPSCAVNDLQLCPKAFVTPLQLKVTLCHEMKHWWDMKITGKDQGEKNVERFGWPCGWLLCVAQHPLNPKVCWTKQDAEIYKKMDPPMNPPTTVHVLWGSHVTGTLTVSNTNATYALENPQLRLKHIMTSGDQYATGDTLGGGVSVGANGLANTAAAGDDVQLIPVGQGAPYQIVIEPGPNGQLDTLPLGDDTLFSSEDRLTSGANGVVETTAQLDDVQVIAVGQGFTAPTFMPLTVGAGPNGVLDSTPGGDDQAVPAPTLPVTNLQATLPLSIPAGSQGAIVVTFDMADHIPGQTPGAGVVQVVFELEADQGGGVRRQTIEMYLFLPPKLYLPMVLRQYP